MVRSDILFLILRLEDTKLPLSLGFFIDTLLYCSVLVVVVVINAVVSVLCWP